MIPTSSAFLLMTGLPEFPPIMSAVFTKFSGVFGLISFRCSNQLFGNANGGWFWWSSECLYAPPRVVVQGNCSVPSWYPLTTPNARRSVKVASGRSEEHTSELQSRFDLVCRLLLDKQG